MPDSNESDEIGRYICISYFPLLLPTPDMTQDQIPQLIAQRPDIDTLGVAWVAEPFRPVLILNDLAREVAEHAHIWAHGKPSDYFYYWFEPEGTGCNFVLMPNLKASADRWKFRLLVDSDTQVPADAKIEFLFQPLHCWLPTATTYSQVVGQLTETLDIGVINRADMEPANPQDEQQEPYWLHNIPVLPPELRDTMVQWLKSVRDDEATE